MDKILLAAGNPVFRRIVALTLREECAAVDTVSTVEELERLSLDGSYRIVITTFTQPLTDGFDLARRLHRRRRPASLFVVTPLRTAEEATTLFESGADQIFSIPVDPLRLRRKVRREFKTAQRQ